MYGVPRTVFSTLTSKTSQWRRNKKLVRTLLARDTRAEHVARIGCSIRGPHIIVGIASLAHAFFFDWAVTHPVQKCRLLRESLQHIQFREGSCLTVQVGLLELESARRVNLAFVVSAQRGGVSFVAAQNLRPCHVAIFPKFALLFFFFFKKKSIHNSWPHLIEHG